MAKGLNQPQVNVNVNFNTENAKRQLLDLKNQLHNISTNAETINLNVGLSQSSLNNVTQQIDSLQAHLRAATNSAGTLDFTKLNRSLNSTNLKNYGESLLQLGPTGQKAFTQLTNAIATSEIPLRRFQGVLGNFGTVLGNTIRWQMASSAIHGVMGAIQGAYSYAQQLNASLNRIQIVTQASNEHMAEFAKSANKAAKELSATTTAYTDASLIFYQQGLNDKEVAERAAATIKMANITGQAAEVVSNQLTAIWNNFDDGSKNLEYYADVITALGAATASSSEEISKGLAKFAPISETVGLSYENASAALATIIATTRQGADSVGTGLRTVFSRLSSLSLGETLEDGVTLTKYSKALQKVGVDVVKANGELRSMDDILADLGDKWGDLTNAQQTALAQTIGGVRQYTTIMALMNNYDFYKENLEIAKNSEGTVQAQADIYAQSWEASQKRIKASAEAIFDDLISDKFFIGLNNVFSKVLDFVHNTINSFGGLKGVLLGIGGLATTIFRENIVQGLIKVKSTLVDSFRSPQYWINQRDYMLRSLSEAKSTYGVTTGVSDETLKRNIGNQMWFAKNQQYLSPYDKAYLELGQEAYNANEAKANDLAVRGAISAEARADYQSYIRRTFVTKIPEEYKQALALSEKANGNWFNNLTQEEREQAYNLGQAGFIKEGQVVLPERYITNEIINQDFNKTLASMASDQFKLSKLDADSQNTINQLLGKGNLTNQDQDQIFKLIKPLELSADALQKIQSGEIKNLDEVFDNEKYQELSEKYGQDTVENWMARYHQELYDKDQAEAAAKAAEAKAKELEQKQKEIELQGKHQRIYTSVASGMMSVGMAFTSMNTVVNQLGEAVEGNIKPGQAAISTLTGVGMSMMQLTNAASGLQAAGILGTGMSAGLIGLIATLGVLVTTLAAKGLDNAIVTAKEHLENLENAAVVNKQYAEDMRQEYDSVKDSFSNHDELLTNLKSLKQGTSEWTIAMSKANSVATDLIDRYDLQINKDFTIDSNGLVQFKSGVQSSINDNLANIVTAADQRSAMSSVVAKIARYNYENYGEQTIDVANDQLRDLREKIGNAVYQTYGEDKENKKNDVLNSLYNDLNFQYLNLSALKGISAEDILNAETLKDLGINPLNGIDISTLNQKKIALNKAVNTNSALGTDLNDLILSYMANDVDFWNTQATNRTIRGRDIYNNQAIGTKNDEYVAQLYKDIFGENAFNLLSEQQQKNENDFLTQQLLGEASRLEAQNKYNKLLKYSQRLTELGFNSWEKLNATERAEQKVKAQQMIDRMAKNDEVREIAQQLLDQETKDEVLAQANLSYLSNTLFGNSDIVKNYLETSSVENLKSLYDVVTKYNTAYGEDTAKYLLEQGVNNNKNIIDVFANLIPSGNALTDMVAVREALTNREVDKNEIEQAVSALRAGAGGAGGILEQLYNTEAFSDLQETFKKTGKLEADTIYEAAEASAELKEYLKDSTVNAVGLAKAIKLIETEQLNVEQMSTSLIQALSVAGSVANGLSETYSYIDNFKSERSVEDVGTFWKKRGKDITTAVNSSFLTDAPAMQSWEAMFGKEVANQYRSRAAILTADDSLSFNQVQEQLKKEFKNNFDLINSINKTGDLRGVFNYLIKNGPTNQNYGDIFSSKNGSIITNDEALLSKGIDTFDKFAKYLENGGISKELAEATASEYLSTNIALGQTFRKNGAAEGLKTLIGENKGFNFTGDELRAYYLEYSDVLKELDTQQLSDIFGTNISTQITDVTSFLNIAKQAAIDAGTTFFDLGENFNYSKTSLTELNKALIDNNKEFADSTNAVKDYLENDLIAKTGESVEEIDMMTGEILKSHQVETGFFNIDFDKAIKDFKRLGIAEEDAYKYLDQMRTQGDFKELSVQLEDASGQMQTLTSESEKYIEYLNKYQLEDTAENFLGFIDEEKAAINAEKAADATAEAFVKALTNVKVDINKDSIISQLQDAFSSFNPEPITLPEINQTIIITRVIKTIDEATGETSEQVITDTSTGSSSSNRGHHTRGGTITKASGYNNIKGFAGGNHSNGQFEGIVETGELGPELWVHDGQAAIVGSKGRQKIYLHPDDQIFTAAQTREILRDNPILEDIPHYSGGYDNEGGDGNDEDDYNKERYHLATRQLTVLEKIYSQLTKIKEESYGTNIIEAIDKQLEATQKLLDRERELRNEVQDYLVSDAEKLKKLLGKEFQIDANGNLTNSEELLEKYGKKAEKDKDENAKKILEAIQKYEGTLDKLQEVDDQIQDYIYQLAELELEKITAKVDMQVKFDDKDLKLLDHQLKKIDDDIYNAAEVLALTGEKMSKVNDQINVTRKGMEDILNNLHDAEGNIILKEDGTAYTVEDWMALSAAERDALNINGEYGDQLEEYTDDLLSYGDSLDELKTKGIEELSDAFKELSEDINDQMDLYDHYNNLLNKTQDILELQGQTMSTLLRQHRAAINQGLLNNIQNQLTSEQQNYSTLQAQAKWTKEYLDTITDPQIKKEYEDLYKDLEKALQQSEEKMLDLWREGLEQAKAAFENALEDALYAYEQSMSGIFGNMDALQAGYDRQKEINEQYVQDYEKYYQINKLQRNINKDLENAAKSGNRQNQRMKALYNELNEARDSGRQLSEYELEIFEKRYEYEKALMELEDARNNKTEVRLHRDANGNWGYVYTSGLDDDALADAEQKRDDTFYELQKTIQTGLDGYVDAVMQIRQTLAQNLKEAYERGATPEEIQLILNQGQQRLDYLESQMDIGLKAAGTTLDKAKDIYANENFKIIDEFKETLASAMTDGGNSLRDYFQDIADNISKINDEMDQAANKHQDDIDSMNEYFSQAEDGSANINSIWTDISAWVDQVGQLSDDNVMNTEEIIKNAELTYGSILAAAEDFESQFMDIYDPVLTRNEEFLQTMLQILGDLNRLDFVNPEKEAPETIQDYLLNHMTEPVSSGSGSGNGGGTPPPAGECPKGGSHVPGAVREYTSGLGYVRITTCKNCGQVMSREYGSWLTDYAKYTPNNQNDSQFKIKQLASGGYTGDWGDSSGRLAILHRKEQVFNADDTQKLLDAAKILHMIDIQSNSFASGLASVMLPGFSRNREELLQNVTITAQFPNVIDHNEIEQAFNNLINKASQYANRKDMSSMTFQDAYTSTT